MKGRTYMKLQLVQFHPEPSDKVGNLDRILGYVDEGLINNETWR